MIIAGRRTRGFQAPVGRHVAPPELDGINGGGGYQPDAPLELPFSWKTVEIGRRGARMAARLVRHRAYGRDVA
jgi:hypothetical protein